MRIFMDGNINSMYEDGRTRGLLLGDSGYPCLPYLMMPIARPTTDNERHYNRSHVMTRNIIESLFGDDDLHFHLRTKLSTSLITSVACCVLHNIAKRHRGVDNVNLELDDDHDNDDDIIDRNMLPPVIPRGNYVRQRLVQQLI